MIPVEKLKSVVAELFSQLDNPDQIANLCRERQIQGFLVNCTSCPMVKLVREYVDFQIAFTMGKKIGSGNWLVVEDEKQTSFPAPQVCDEFSDRFDCKLYSDLIAFGDQTEQNTY